MPIETTCRRCGAPYTPTRDDIVKGPEYWRLCPNCRPLAVAERSDPSASADRRIPAA